jgi:hypothetical protein
MTAALPGDAITVTDEEKIVIDTGIVPPRCQAEECRDEMFGKSVAARIGGSVQGNHPPP